ncbi:MAG: MFS transporter, partial [Caulobacterales bacterium]|nr:MFS transporter [Caulobacterales bacterium]
MTTIDAAAPAAPAADSQIPRAIKLSWGTGALGVALLMNGVSFLILFYMVSVLGVEPALAGAIIFITKIFDVISDPVVGGWSDRVRTA